MLKPMTAELRKKIKMYIKNKIDISPLVQEIDVKGEDLSYAIIKNFTRVKVDISKVDLSNAIIGEQGRTTNLSNNTMKDCNFSDTIFLGKVFMRRCDCRGSNFSGADVGNVEYQYSNFEGCNFCEVKLRLGVDYGLGAKFSQDFFRDLAKGWNIQINIK